MKNKQTQFDGSIGRGLDARVQPGVARRGREGRERRQDAPGPFRWPQWRRPPGVLQQDGDDLKLSAGQKTKVQEVFKNRGEKGRAIREDSSLSEEQKREKGKALMEETNKKMKEILNAEQYEKWEKNRQQGRRGGFGGQGSGPRKGGDKK